MKEQGRESQERGETRAVPLHGLLSTALGPRCIPLDSPTRRNFRFPPSLGTPPEPPRCGMRNMGTPQNTGKSPRSWELTLPDFLCVRGESVQLSEHGRPWKDDTPLAQSGELRHGGAEGAPPRARRDSPTTQRSTSLVTCGATVPRHLDHGCAPRLCVWPDTRRNVGISTGLLPQGERKHHFSCSIAEEIEVRALGHGAATGTHAADARERRHVGGKMHGRPRPHSHVLTARKAVHSPHHGPMGDPAGLTPTS